MLPKKMRLLSLIVIAALLAGCVIVPTPLPTFAPGAASTWAAQTLAVQAPTKTMDAIRTAANAPTQAVQPTFTPQPTRPSATPMPTNTLQGPLFSPTPTLKETLTATFPAPVSLLALADMNCRAGPGRIYPILGYLAKDARAAVLGRNPEATWWYIQLPDKPEIYCWVWGETSEVSGDIARLEVIIVPTPEPYLDFEVGFVSTLKCGNSEYLIFRVTNTGNVTLSEAIVTIVNIQTQKTLYGPISWSIPNMATAKTCPTGTTVLLAGERGFLAITRTDKIVNGISLRAIIQMCKSEGPEPRCLEKKLNFSL